jgi:transcription initiation factor TFIID subunit 9B
MASSQGKHIPKDTQIIVSIMKDLGISDYDQQVLNHLLEFNHRYTTLLLDDAKTYSNFAKKKNVDVDDVKIAIQLAQDGVFFRPPPREVLIASSDEVNKIVLPSIRPSSGLRIPHDRSNFLQTNYKLRTDLYSGVNMRKTDTKTTAAEMLEASRKMEIDDNVYSQSDDQIINNSIDFDLQEIIESRQSSQDSPAENGKDDIMETQSFENRSYSDIALEDTVEKQLNEL